MAALMELLAPLLEAAFAWLLRMLGKLFSAYAFSAVLSASGISLAGQFLFVAAFMGVVFALVSKIMSEFQTYITSLFSFSPTANSAWLSFVSLLPVNLGTNIQIMVSAASFIIGLRLLILIGKLFVVSSADKLSVKTK